MEHSYSMHLCEHYVAVAGACSMALVVSLGGFRYISAGVRLSRTSTGTYAPCVVGEWTRRTNKGCCVDIPYALWNLSWTGSCAPCVARLYLRLPYSMAHNSRLAPRLSTIQRLQKTNGQNIAEFPLRHLGKSPAKHTRRYRD